MQTARYNSVAISLHWLIAILLVGLVVLSQVMIRYPEDDPFRFELIQWHKSFGILTLLLVVIRLVWRITHRPPSLPRSIKPLERLGAGGAHVVLYLLMFLIPLSGWVMVSASPLNLKTELFGLIPWPHVPLISEMADKAAIAKQFHNIHHLLAEALVVIVALHVLAALRHQLFLKDAVMSRMFLSSAHGRDNNHGIVAGALIAAAGSIYLMNTIQSSVAPVVINETSETASSAVPVESRVGFTAMQMGEALNGVFRESDVVLILDRQNLTTASLEATVNTGSVDTGDGQTDATVVTADWFASNEYPNATFYSDEIELLENDSYLVKGILTIRDVSESIDFPMSVTSNIARGSFNVDRKTYGVGNDGQDEFVDAMVTIHFKAMATNP